MFNLFQYDWLGEKTRAFFRGWNYPDNRIIEIEEKFLLGEIMEIRPASVVSLGGVEPSLRDLVLEHFRSRFSEDKAQLYAAQYQLSLLSALRIMVATDDEEQPEEIPSEALNPFDELPEGLWERNGVFYFECSACGNESEWFDEPENFDLHGYANYCGGSPRCIP